MITTELDTLVLNIEVNDKRDGETAAKKISTLNRVLNKFQTTVKTLDTKTFRTKFASMTSSIKPFVSQLNTAKSTILALDRVLKKMSVNKVKDAIKNGTVGEVDTPEENKTESTPSAQNGTSQDLPDAKKEKETIESLISKYGALTKTVDDADKTRTLYFERYNGSDKITTKYTAKLEEQDGKLKEVAGSFQYVGQTASEVTGGGLKSFFLSIKRIALYRAIRTSLKVITQSLKEGIVNLAAFDEKSRATMSEITSSITIMKNSLGVAIMPLIQAITPIIQGISKAVGTLANAISYLSAKLKGETTWLKVNTEYLKEFNKQSNLLSFDEFNSLKQDDTSGMFTTEQMQGSSLSSILGDCTALSGVLTGIATTLGIIGGAKILGLITGGKLLTSIKSIWTTTLSFSGTIQGLAVGIGALAGGLVYFITNLDQMNTTAKILIPVLTILLGIITGLAVAHAAAKAGIAAPAMAAITAGALVAGLTLVAGTAIAVSKHANGGMFEGTGTLYHQAGEAGAEIVATGSKGTGVTNISQFKQAMVEALSEYDAARNNDEPGTLVVMLDGKEIAKSQATNNANALMQKYNLVLKPR